jgi:hypothetical protein
MPLDHHGSDILHSFYGRQFGLDPNRCLTGMADIKHLTETITSTVATTLAAGGTSVLLATASGVYTIQPPSNRYMLGSLKRIINASTAAVSMLVKLTTGNFLSAFGSSANTITLSTRGAALDLEYISSALVAVMNVNSSSTAGYFLLTTTT